MNIKDEVKKSRGRMREARKDPAQYLKETTAAGPQIAGSLDGQASSDVAVTALLTKEEQRRAVQDRLSTQKEVNATNDVKASVDTLGFRVQDGNFNIVQELKVLGKKLAELKDAVRASSRGRGGPGGILDDLDGPDRDGKGKGGKAGKSRFKLGNLGKIATAATLAIGALEVGRLWTDDEASTSDKVEGTAKTAGMVGGALAGGSVGATAGAAIGSVVPVVGTAVGGVVGGAVGGAAGAFLGEEAITTFIDWAKRNTIENETLSTNIGRATAMAVAPFSEEARDTLARDWKNNIQPGLDRTFKPLTDATGDLVATTKDNVSALGTYANAIGAATSAMWNSVGKASDALIETTKDVVETMGSTAGSAWAAIKAGWAKGGAKGVVDAVRGDAANAVVEGASRIGQQVSSGADKAGAELSAGVQNAGSAYQQVVEAGRGYTVVKNADGSVERREGARNWRNNNPGNMEYNEYTKKLGAIGSDGRFAIFPTYEAGRAAKEKMIFEGKNYKDLDLNAAIARYAPPSENQTGVYQRKVLESVGGTVKRMSDYTPEERQKIMTAMEQMEGFKVGRTTLLQPGTETKVAGEVNAAPSTKATQFAAQSKSPSAQAVRVAQAPTKAESAAPEVTETRRASQPMLQPNQPEEVRQVLVANAGGEQTTTNNTKVIGGGAAPGAPTLNDVPIQISDMGLVLLNIAHV